jgi:hypothetical protein
MKQTRRCIRCRWSLVCRDVYLRKDDFVQWLCGLLLCARDAEDVRPAINVVVMSEAFSRIDEE